MGDHVVVLNESDFYGECAYLGVTSTDSSAVVIVESDS